MTRDEQRALAVRLEAALRAGAGRNYKDIAKEVGCSTSTVWMHAQRLGVANDAHAKRVEAVRRLNDTERHEQEVRLFWEHGLTAKQIAARTGLSFGGVNSIAARIGLKHSDEYVRRRRSEGSIGRRPNSEKISRSKRELYAKERMRMRVGLPRQTRYRIVDIPKCVAIAIKGLVAMYGYFRSEDDPYTLYYDSETTRLPLTPDPHARKTRRHCERYFTEKYGIMFKSAED